VGVLLAILRCVAILARRLVIKRSKAVADGDLGLEGRCYEPELQLSRARRGGGGGIQYISANRLLEQPGLLRNDISHLLIMSLARELSSLAPPSPHLPVQ
jgi:hypothetical protein